MERIPTSLEHDEPIVYSLDRRGPNDPLVGSIHLVIVVLTTVLVAAALAVL